jgi:putative transposase
VELAHQLCRPHGPYTKSAVARALDLARGTFYIQSKQAQKDKEVAVAVESWHEQDDTMGHRKLAVLLGMGKNRVKRVMKKYGITARRKKKRYVYPGKTNSVAPNLLREPKKNVKNVTDVSSSEIQGNVMDGSPSTGGANSTNVQQVEAEVVFSDIFEVCLADRTKVRGCFALWKKTRHILSLAFDYRMQADLVVSTIEQMHFDVPGSIFHSDQGSQYGAEQTRKILLEKGFLRSMSRAGTPTDNGYAERFVGTFKLAVAERRRYQTLGHFLRAAEHWINFYNHERPHEGIGNCSPDPFACREGLPPAPYLPLL